MQPELAEALLQVCKEQCLATALEPCSHAPGPVFERLLAYLDIILHDPKHLDSQVHRICTGVDSSLILSNLRRLAAQSIPMVVRIPLVPGFNLREDALRGRVHLWSGEHG